MPGGRVQRLAARLLRWAERPWALAACVGAALLLTAPSVGIGLQLDDYVHRAVLLRIGGGDPALESSALDLFHLSRGDPERVRALMEGGFAPWWTDPDLRLSFLRPAASLSHAFDWRVVPDRPVLMHLHSLLWYAALVLAAAVALRAILGPRAGAAAALATWIFAVDDAHGVAVGWLANRNMLLAGTFGFLAVAAHLRWRGGWKAGAWLAPLLLALALLSAEAALGAAAYIAAAALVLEERDWRAQLRSVAPAAAVLALWAGFYALAGYGASGSALYVDPLGRPAAWLRGALERFPVLFLGQWALPTSGLHAMVSRPIALALSAAGWVAVLVLARALLPWLRRDRVAGFLALGSVLALLPVTSTMPGDRLLVFAGLGAAGVVARMLQEVARGALPAGGATAGIAWAFVLVHLLIAPLSLPFVARSAAFLERIQVGAFDGVLLDRPSGEFDVVLVQAPSALIAGYLPAVRAAQGRPVPRRVRMLAPATVALEVEREDERTLLLRSDAGWFPAPGTGLEGEPAFALGYALQHLEGLFRDRPMQRGELVRLTDVEVEVLEVDAHGSVRAVRVRFDRPLESADLAWITYRDGAFTPFELPPVGAAVR